MEIPTAFFAYPSQPPSVSEVVRVAASEINDSGLAAIKGWEELQIGGKLIVDEICAEIKKANFLCADITGLNPNVLFEIGYAIGANKRIWLALDTSLSDAGEDFRQLHILTTVGYASSTSAHALTMAFYREQPFADLTDTLLSKVIQPNLAPNAIPKLFYMKMRHDTEASRQITRRIGSSTLEVVTDDPAESSVQPLTWYGSQVYSAHGVICHLTAPNRQGARLHNARYALVAGMAYGMGKPLLMLTEGDHLAPLDYRDILNQYQTASQAVTCVDAWMRPVETRFQEHRVARDTYASSIRLATELRGLQLGEYVAENEVEGLTEHYFVETHAYDEVIAGDVAIFVGRKGTGKSANLIKAAAKLKSDARNIVCVIKPESYELQAAVKLLAAYHEKDLKGYAIESLWKFLIYTEIANQVALQIESRGFATADSNEMKLVELLGRDDGLLRMDFSVRLERCVESLKIAEAKHNAPTTLAGTRLAISEMLHEGLLGEIRRSLGDVLTKRNRVAILIDNLDKAWDKQASIDDVAQFLLGLLGIADRITRDLRSDSARNKPIQATLAVFLRSDIFYKVMAAAQEPDKIVISKIDWNDPEVLLRVAEERFLASHADAASPEDMWERYFCDQVRGMETKQYLLDRILRRPRDLLFFLKSAIATAVNRKHGRVMEEDIIDAERVYSQYALDSVKVENGLTGEQIETIIFEFIGAQACVPRNEVECYLSRVGIPAERYNYVIERLCSLSFLGVEVSPNKFRFAQDQDPQETRKNEVLARKLIEQWGGEARYMVNKPFWAYLEIVEP